LATQIGSNLKGVLYVLDEPSIGLHQRDNRQLLATLRRLAINVVESSAGTPKEATEVNASVGSCRAVAPSDDPSLGRIVVGPVDAPDV
jgi:hypothetical protein